MNGNTVTKSICHSSLGFAVGISLPPAPSNALAARSEECRSNSCSNVPPAGQGRHLKSVPELRTMKQQAHLLSLDQSQVWLACYYHNYCIKEYFIIFILVWLVVGVNIDNRYQQLFFLYLTGILRDSSGQIFPLMRVEEVGRKLFSHFSFSPASLSHSFQSGRPRWRPERIGGGQEC